MTRRSAASQVFVFDPDLDAVVEITRTNREPERRSSDGVQIIRDLEPYRAIGADEGGALRPVIGGRRQHREFLARNGYVEVGNERPKPRTTSWVDERHARDACVADIKQAMGKL